MTLDQKLEAILFYTAAPLKKERAASVLEVSREALENVIQTLHARLQGGATRVVETDEQLELVAAPEAMKLLDEFVKVTHDRSIGKAGAETLAIIAYRGPISRGEIDRIRGVNSSYILRTLQTRGLVEQRRTSTKTEYQPTTELFKHLGVEKRSDLPQYTETMAALTEFESVYEDPP